MMSVGEVLFSCCSRITVLESGLRPFKAKPVDKICFTPDWLPIQTCICIEYKLSALCRFFFVCRDTNPVCLIFLWTLYSSTDLRTLRQKKLCVTPFPVLLLMPRIPSLVKLDTYNQPQHLNPLMTHCLKPTTAK